LLRTDERKNMVLDYANKSIVEKRVGLHYRHFLPFLEDRSPDREALASRRFLNLRSNPRSRVNASSPVRLQNWPVRLKRA
jgi:hypothetical protein